MEPLLGAPALLPQAAALRLRGCQGRGRRAGAGGPVRGQEVPSGSGAPPEETGVAQADGAPGPGAAPGQPRVAKLVLLGSGSVGKSSLALRYVRNDFKSILPTVGCAFFTTVADLGAASLAPGIWDTAGQGKHRSACRLYFRGASAVLLVHDVSRKDSFRQVQRWLGELEQELPPGEAVVVLVGNKTDLEREREVTFQEGQEFVESRRLLFMEASAKLDHQVTEVFSTVARELLRRQGGKERAEPPGGAGLAPRGAPGDQARSSARRGPRQPPCVPFANLPRLSRARLAPLGATDGTALRPPPDSGCLGAPGSLRAGRGGAAPDLCPPMAALPQRNGASGRAALPWSRGRRARPTPVPRPSRGARRRPRLRTGLSRLNCSLHPGLVRPPRLLDTVSPRPGCWAPVSPPPPAGCPARQARVGGLRGAGSGPSRALDPAPRSGHATTPGGKAASAGLASGTRPSRVSEHSAGPGIHDGRSTAPGTRGRRAGEDAGVGQPRRRPGASWLR